MAQQKEITVLLYDEEMAVEAVDRYWSSRDSHERRHAPPWTQDNILFLEFDHVGLVLLIDRGNIYGGDAFNPLTGEWFKRIPWVRLPSEIVDFVRNEHSKKVDPVRYQKELDRRMGW